MIKMYEQLRDQLPKKQRIELSTFALCLTLTCLFIGIVLGLRWGCGP